MEYISCHSILEEIKNDFEQLHNYVADAQNYIKSWQSENSGSDEFEVPRKLLEPLENLSMLTLLLFKNTESKLNDKQLRALTGWKCAIASSYCFIQRFLQADDGFNLEGSAMATKSVSFQFYFHASYELRTPISNLKAYSQMIRFYSSDYLIPPLIPVHEDTLLQVDFWIDQLVNFINTLIERIRNYQ